ncbi:MAG: Asp23/Gls24 family envelope stress response protein [Candidatus Caldatribacteriaceae bacterium]
MEKNRAESVRIESRKDLISLNLFLIFDLERRAPEVAWELQRSLKEVIERKTGLRIDRINIYVQGFEAQRKEHSSSLDILR